MFDADLNAHSTLYTSTVKNKVSIRVYGSSNESTKEMLCTATEITKHVDAIDFSI